MPYNSDYTRLPVTQDLKELKERFLEFVYAELDVRNIIYIKVKNTESLGYHERVTLEIPISEPFQGEGYKISEHLIRYNTTEHLIHRCAMEFANRICHELDIQENPRDKLGNYLYGLAFTDFAAIFDKYAPMDSFGIHREFAINHKKFKLIIVPDYVIIPKKHPCISPIFF